MKKLLLSLVAMLVGMTAQAKCDWSKVKVNQITQFRSYYKFQAKGLESDSCTEFFWMFTYRNAKGQLLTDTFGYNANLVDFQVNLKGKFKLSLKAINSCDGCDTTWNFELEQIVFKYATFYGKETRDCKTYEFAMNLGDSCIKPYWYVFDYDGNQIHYDSGYTMTYTFPWEGQFEVYAQWWNQCYNQDTFYGQVFDVFCDSTTNGLTPISPSIGGMARPNPASCEFYITETRVPMEYMILNTSGTIIAVGNTSPFEQTRIESCRWPNGVYYIWIMGLGRELIMIQH